MDLNKSFLGRLRRTWFDLTGIFSNNGDLDPTNPTDLARLREQMESCFVASGGEVLARSRAVEMGRTYLGLDMAGREKFLALLAEDFDIDRQAVAMAMEAVGKAGEDTYRAACADLRDALQPRRVKLLTQFNGLPEGVKFLVDLRVVLLECSRSNPALTALDRDLKTLLASWFDVGFLELRQITWNSPALLLEKLIAYEAVHEIRSWEDLKNRLDSDRRCFAFFHPRMPEEPLIFVEVALVNGLAGNVQELLDEDAPLIDPMQADTAIFYSISNAQRGLDGISFGAFLIKRVVDLLAVEFPGLKTFSTLSPIPGFRTWFERGIESGQVSLREEEKSALAEALDCPAEEVTAETISGLEEWQNNPALTAALEPVLMRLCASYLLSAKARSGRALDPVARFHLNNGARAERLCWAGNLARSGIRASFGLMVNYSYRLDKIEENHEAYRAGGEVVASSAIRRLAGD